MGNIFSGSEVVEIGIQIEKNGKDFYNALVKKAKNKDAMKIFNYLAKEEEKHIAVFQGIFDSVSKYEPPESYPGEYFAYMNALAAEYVFTQANKGAETAGSVKSDSDAVDLGIKFEKDSIIFYEGTKKVVPDYDSKVIDELIIQEQDHLRILMGLKRNL